MTSATDDLSEYEYYTPTEAAEKLRVHPYTVRAWIREYEATGGAAGLGPVCRFGPRTIRIPASTLSDYLQASKA